jgi:hypothetical protein
MLAGQSSAWGSDFGSGVNTILISDNGGSGKSSPITLDDGIHNLTITATDKAGNSRSVSQTVFVDTTGPVISQFSTGTSGINGWYVSAVNVNATASDDGSGLQGDVEVSMDNGSTWNAVPVQLSDGLHDLTYRAYDRAGNLSTSSASVSIDTTPPSLDISTTGSIWKFGWYKVRQQLLLLQLTRSRDWKLLSTTKMALDGKPDRLLQVAMVLILHRFVCMIRLAMYQLKQ